MVVVIAGDSREVTSVTTLVIMVTMAKVEAAVLVVTMAIAVVAV